MLLIFEAEWLKEMEPLQALFQCLAQELKRLVKFTDIMLDDGILKNVRDELHAWEQDPQNSAQRARTA